MNESDAKAAFRRMGIIRPSRDLIENWLSVAAADERAAAQASPGEPSSASVKQAGLAVVEAPRAPAPPQPPARGKSILEPLLRDQGAIEKPPTKRKLGRPRIVASWFPEVAKTMADGTTLATALAINGLALSANEMRALYRNRTFQGLYQEARRRYLLENWGRKRPSLRSLLGRVV
jgi:hypothetical protein